MAIGRNIEESLLKAVRSLEIGTHHIELPELADITDDDLIQKWFEHKMIACFM